MEVISSYLPSAGIREYSLKSNDLSRDDTIRRGN